MRNDSGHLSAGQQVETQQTSLAYAQMSWASMAQSHQEGHTAAAAASYDRQFVGGDFASDEEEEDCFDQLSEAGAADDSGSDGEDSRGQQL